MFFNHVNKCIVHTCADERERERERERAALCDGGGGGDRMMMSGGGGWWPRDG